MLSQAPAFFSMPGTFHHSWIPQTVDQDMPNETEKAEHC